MYVGHFATGILLKAFFPAVPAAPIMYGIGFLDILDGLFTIIGVNTVRPNLNAGPYLYYDLVFIDWDHSLAMALVLSVLWALIAASRSGSASGSTSSKALVAGVAFAASFSHWLCDLPFHDLDLAAYPYSVEHYGWRWWARFMTGAWVMEGVFSAVCVALAGVVFARRGVSIKGPAVACVLMLLSLSPWASPMYYIAQMAPPADYLVHGALLSLGFVVPAAVIVRMLDGAEERGAGKRAVLGKKVL